jgi:carbamoyltransferase
MSYNILGINTNHNGSVCVLVNGEIDFFLEEERFSKIKTDHNPTEIIKFISKKYTIDEIAISGLTQRQYSKEGTLYFHFLTTFFPNTPIHSYLESHHDTHIISAYTNSGFKESLGIVVDGCGSRQDLPNSKEYILETESMYYLGLSNFQSIYKSYKTTDPQLNIDNLVEFNNNRNTIGQIYQDITELLGFNWNEAGKTMGLSSYGSPNFSIPNLIVNRRGNPKIFKSNGVVKSPNVSSHKFNPNFSYLASNEDLRKDLAYKIQDESQKEVGDLIEKGLKETGLKQVCCAGGYFLNCVANYYLTKRFPNIDFYFEPISSDAGTSIGAAKMLWHQKTQDTTIRPQKTLYYGPKYSKEDLLKGIQKYVA